MYTSPNLSFDERFSLPQTPTFSKVTTKGNAPWNPKEGAGKCGHGYARTDGVLAARAASGRGRGLRLDVRRGRGV